MTPLEVKELLCLDYNKLRHKPRCFALMSTLIRDGERHCGVPREDLVPPMMKADYPDTWRLV
jgi:hypothetical protein